MSVRNVSAKVAGVLVFVTVGLALFWALYAGAGGRSPLYNPYKLNIVVPDAFQLVQNADVRQAGVKVGRIGQVTNRGGNALVRLELDDDHAPVYRDATTLLRTKTLVGENYIELDPGNPRTGKIPDGGIIPLRRSGEAVQLDQILSALDPTTRAAVQRNLDGLSGGLVGRSRDLNALFGQLRPTTADGADVVSVLADQRAEFAGLVRDTGSLTRAVADQRGQLQTLARSARAAAAAAASRDRALGQTIDGLPGVLAQTRTSVRRLQRFSGAALPVIRDLDQGVTRLQPVMRALPAAASRTRELVGQLRPFLTVADPMLDRLRPFARALAPALPALDALLDQAQPALAYLRPFSPEVGSFLANQAAHGSYRDKFGGGDRIFSHIDPDSLTGIGPEYQRAVDALQKAGAVAVDGPHMDENPYPKPGTIGKPELFDGTYPTISARP
ncbi:MAG: virulence factor Mce family protein [Conexibacter sp.]|nr:virulence factor Mce family protein [Conexibacter sp.]